MPTIPQISQNYDIHCLDVLAGQEADAVDALQKYTNKHLVAIRVFVYGLLKRYGAYEIEGFNTLTTIQRG